ncbi:mitochondrial 54S ribosomal protein mL44 MRPL3 [Rhodotorula paludigena]|uniref:mitochondrial 54S ribosomal protein mL44 MRPL3 n=1 Tax=Rhodotorula paludigena TaxID=86838 RepID=UPI00317E4DA0
MSKAVHAAHSAARAAPAASTSSAALRLSAGKSPRTAHCSTPRQPGQARPLSTSASRAASTVIRPRPPIPQEVVRSRPHPSDLSSTQQDPDGADTESPAEPVEAAPEPQQADDAFVPPPLTQQQLSLLYSYTTPPPESALSAFAARIALSASASPSASSSSSAAAAPVSLASHLPLVEQALIHESFWEGVRTLHDTLSLSSATAPAGRRYTTFHDAPLADAPSTTPSYAHNGALAALGNSLLGSFATELVLQSFPHLPARAAKAAVTLYVGPKSLAAVASQSWGVGPSRLDLALVGKEDEGKVSRKDRAYGHLVGGRGGARKLGHEVGAKEGAAGAGLIRWNRKPTSFEKDAVLFEDALASVARAIVGAVHEVHGFSAARAFVHAHFLSRVVPPSSTALASPLAAQDLAPLLKFANPSRVLSLSLTAHGLPPLRHALLKESGRLSAHPTFVTGAFAGDLKLGEGFGSSVKMSQWRASEDALRRVYLGGKRQDGLPSDAWAEAQGKAFGGWRNASGFTEVEQESR